MSEAAALVGEFPARYAADLDRVLRGIIGERDDPIHRMVRYHLGWVDERGRPGQFNRGKGLRSTLCLLACEALGGDHRPALPAAAALDLLHNFTLAHDDIMDRDVLRRGRASVWKLWGVAQAINVGDLLYARAFTALGDLASPKTVVAAHRLLADTCVTLVQGQAADIAFERREDVSVDEYLDMISRKTAALIGASLRLGALAAGAPPATRDGLAELGLAMGIAFQIIDDYCQIRLLLAGTETHFSAHPGRHLSLSPLTGNVCGVTTEGLRWPLLSEDLIAGERDGISNEVVKSPVMIRVAGPGDLLLMMHREAGSAAIEAFDPP